MQSCYEDYTHGMWWSGAELADNQFIKTLIFFSGKHHAPLLFDVGILDIVQNVLQTSHNGVRELAQKLLNTVANFESSQKKIKS